MSEYRSRIVGEGEESPEQLLANPQNFRRHPKQQLDALEGVLEEIGWVQRVVANKRTGHLIDGHARVELAIRRGEKSVPVLYVDLTEAEERIALATMDPIGSLAYQDDEALKALLDSIAVENAALQEFLTNLETEQKAGGAAANQDALRTTLTEQFLIPPFTLFDARQGYWQDRKRAWKELGLASEDGRGENLLFGDQKGDVGARILAAGGGTSIFDPVLCEVAYRWYAPPGGRILDPFAGGSVRGVVAAVLGYDYTGVDLRPEQVEANRANWERISNTQGEKPEPIPMSAAWATKHFDCTLAHIQSPDGCGGVCCRHKTCWPPNAYENNVCEHLGDAGCTLSQADKPATCQLYPFIFNKTGKLVMHDKAQLPTSFCKGASGKGPMLIDAMEGGLTNLFGRAQFLEAREDVLNGRDAVFYPTPEVAEALRHEAGLEAAGQPVTPRTQREKATPTQTSGGTDGGVVYVN